MSGQADPDMECIVCRKHRGLFAIPGGAIYQDELVYASHAQIRTGEATAYLGYLMAEPKRHVAGLSGLTDAEAERLGLLVSRLSRALVGALGAEHVYSFVLGDKVPHVHIHVVPRYPGAPQQYRGVHVDEWPEAPRGGAAEMERICQRLTEHLAGGAH